MTLPTSVAIVGKMRAPHNTRVADKGSDRGTVSAGIRAILEQSAKYGNYMYHINSYKCPCSDKCPLPLFRKSCCSAVLHKWTTWMPVCFYGETSIRVHSWKKEFAPIEANSFLSELDHFKKGGKKKENRRTASIGSESIHLNTLYLKYFGSSFKNYIFLGSKK